MTLIPRMVLVAVLAAGLGALLLSGDVEVDDTLGVRKTLPDRVGAYTAVDWAFCHNDQCARAFRVHTLDDPDECPECGGALFDRSLGEKLLLPAGTTLAKRSYLAPDTPEIHVSVVISGHERRSIHKPQVCLTGQGNTIVSETIRQVALPGRDTPLDVMFLDVKRSRGSTVPTSSYAYWFASPTRETARHISRLLWIAWDSVLHNRRQRWAYVAISSTNESSAKGARPRIERFIKQFYPRVTPDGAAGSPE